MKHQILAIGLATISALNTFSAIDPVSAQTPVQSHTIEVSVRVELFDKDDNAQEGIDINPLGGLKILNLRYNPATGEILNEQGKPVAQRDRAFDMEGLGDGEKKATIKLSIAHK